MNRRRFRSDVPTVDRCGRLLLRQEAGAGDGRVCLRRRHRHVRLRAAWIVPRRKLQLERRQHHHRRHHTQRHRLRSHLSTAQGIGDRCHSLHQSITLAVLPPVIVNLLSIILKLYNAELHGHCLKLCSCIKVYFHLFQGKYFLYFFSEIYGWNRINIR